MKNVWHGLILYYFRDYLQNRQYGCGFGTARTESLGRHYSSGHILRVGLSSRILGKYCHKVTDWGPNHGLLNVDTSHQRETTVALTRSDSRQWRLRDKPRSVKRWYTIHIPKGDCCNENGDYETNHGLLNVDTSYQRETTVTRSDSRQRCPF